MSKSQNTVPLKHSLAADKALGKKCLTTAFIWDQRRFKPCHLCLLSKAFFKHLCHSKGILYRIFIYFGGSDISVTYCYLIEEDEKKKPQLADWLTVLPDILPRLKDIYAFIGRTCCHCRKPKQRLYFNNSCSLFFLSYCMVSPAQAYCQLLSLLALAYIVPYTKMFNSRCVPDRKCPAKCISHSIPSSQVRFQSKGRTLLMAKGIKVHWYITSQEVQREIYNVVIAHHSRRLKTDQ